MIVAILKGIAIALAVAAAFAFVAGLIFVGVTMIAMASYRRHYGDEYDWDDDNQHEEDEL